MKKSKILNLIGALAISLSLGMSFGITAYADGTDQNEVTKGDIYHDIISNPDGTVSIIQRNKVRDGGIFTRTVAYNATNLATGETITIGRNGTNIAESAPVRDPVTGWNYVTITTTLNPADSAKVLEAAHSGTLQMDNVMALTFNGGETFSAQWNSITGQVEYDSAFTTTNPLATYILNQSGGDGAFGYGEMETYISILQRIGFADPQGFRTNFEKILQLGEDGQWYKLAKALIKDGETLEEALERIEKEKEDDPTDPKAPDKNTDTDELQGFPVSSGPAKIEYYNDSRNYYENGQHKGFADVFDSDQNGPGIIIPSSEKYLTGVTVSSYAGTFSLGMHSMDKQIVRDGFYFQSYLEREEWEVVGQKYAGYDDWIDYDGDGEQDYDEWEPHYDDVYGWVTHTKRETGGSGYDASVGGYVTSGSTPALRAYYVYIYDLDMYDFGSATTTNETFTTGSQTFEGTNSHTLSDIPPQEDGNGDPIGPVGATEPGVDTISNRPQYSVSILNGGSISGEGSDGATPMTQFSPGAEYLEWTEVHFDKEAERNLGGFSHMIGRHGNGHYAPWPNDPVDGTNASNAKAAADNLVRYWVGDGHTNDQAWLNNVHLKHCDMTGYARYKNDSLTIGYKHHTIISSANDGDVLWDVDETYGQEYKANDSSKWPKYLAAVINSVKGAATDALTNPDKETYESIPAFSLSQQYIKDTMDNGEYPTSYAGAEYMPILYYSGHYGYSAAGSEKAEWINNNPIIVQTPVVGPVVMYDDPDTGSTPDNSLAISTADQSHRKTQHLYNTVEEGYGRNNSLVQLRLDESYWFKFDPLEHLSTQGYADINGIPFDNTWDKDNIKFDKYVQAKYVHFPFAVCLYEEGHSKPTYYPLVTDESDPGYWIEVYGPDAGYSNIEWTRFYIPVWALEGSYSGDDSVKYKVEAINVNDRSDLESAQHDLRNDDDANEPLAAEDKRLYPDKDLYVATYKIGVQVSGWIYDFQIVGLNNRDTFDKQLSDTLSTQWHDLLYPLAWNYEEKKTGTLNRLGADSQHRYDTLSKYVRYTRSGEIAHTGDTVENSVLDRDTSSSVGWIVKDTIILDNTKSHKYDDSGTSPKGTEFAFSVRTISNLWNDGDTVQITPSFTYLTDDGTKYTSDTGLHVYYNDSTGSNENLFIEFGSARDKALMRTVSLSNEMFNGSYYKDDLEKTVLRPQYDETSASFSNRESAADIATLVNTFKNKQTESYCLSNINMDSGLRIFSGDLDQIKENLQYDHDSADIHTIADMYLTRSDADYNAIESCINPSMQTWYGAYTLPSELFVSTMTAEEINEYASTHGGISEDNTDVWMQDGYLIVNFDIKSHNSLDKNKDLRYQGTHEGLDNMWQGQGQDTTAEVGNLHADSSDGHYGHKIINVDYGDVIIIDMGQSIDDWFTANIYTVQ